MSSEALEYELSANVAVLRLDDGKVNALSRDVVDALGAALDRAEKEAAGVLLVGRPGRFSAGFDLRAMTTPDSVRDLVGAGGRLLMRLFTHPRPVVAACSGHALAAGALLLLSSDARIGADIDAKIGLNEVAIGMGVPEFLVEIARHRISKRHLTRAMTQAEMYTPAQAIDPGYLDRVVPEAQLFEVALAEAKRLAQLPDPAFRQAKRAERGAVADRVLAGLDADMEKMSGPRS